MASVVVTVCDVCMDVDKSTTHWSVSGEGGAREVDLCVEHAKPLLALVHTVAQPKAKATADRRPKKATESTPRRKRPGRHPDRRVTTMEEIAALEVD